MAVLNRPNPIVAPSSPQSPGLNVKCTPTTLTVNGPGNCFNTGLPVVNTGSSELQLILQILFAVIGALAVLFIVIGGFRYVISDGNPKNMETAKNTIIYAVIGLIIALFAEAIVTFVLGHIT